MSLRTPLAQVRGLGSAKQGAHHWWMQRITALMLVPLLVWLVGTMVSLVTGDYATVIEALRNPITAGVLLMTIIVIFYHAALGLQVVIEDYISGHGTQVGAIVIMRFVMGLLAVISIVAVLKVVMGG